MPVTNQFGIESAVRTSASGIRGISGNSKIAIINISANNPDEAEFVIEELSTELVRLFREDKTKSHDIVDRRSLEAIRRERKLQFSGDIDDNTIVSVGKFLGADVVIRGSIIGQDDFRRLRIKALDVLTAKLLVQINSKY
jgi:curli biogenesis system outer membrane secretion channel CsgG